MDLAVGSSLITCGYPNTQPIAESVSSAKPIGNPHRVSSHDLYQSMSVLPLDGPEKILFQRHGRDVDRDRRERLRFGEHHIGPHARENGHHPSFALHPPHAWRAEREVGRVAV